ncbi:MAG: adenine phosphoribosyltransferase [Gammaproteobacteria bacterium]|nr:adenine phosphoribosyltransferase [Gammaproteobacteria bacterium]
MTTKTHPLTIGSLRRDLPLFEVKPGLRIAVLNILGDVELVEAACVELAPRLAEKSPHVLVTPEAKSIPLACMLAARMRLPYVVLRKSCKSYMGEALSATTHSITTGANQTLYLDEKDRGLIQGARIAIVDDVVSTGSTLKGVRDLIALAGGEVVAEAAICTEGDQANWKEVISLAHLPLFTDTHADGT